MKKLQLTALCFLIFSVFAFGQGGDLKSGMTGAKFLSVPVSVRGAAMGEAFVAMADDPSSVFWNVAGLTQIKGNSFYASNTQWVADIQFEAAAITLDASRLGKIALHGRVMHMGEMRVRTAFAPDGTGEMFTVQSFAAGVGWAKKMTEQFSMGLNFSFIREEYYGITADGWGVDVGSIYDTRWRGMKIGMSMLNFGPDMHFDGTYRKWHDIEEPGVATAYKEFPIPLTFRFGITLNVLEIGNDALVLVADATHPADNAETINLGFELPLMNMLFLRAGYKFGGDEDGISAGAGINVPFINTSIDVAYSDMGLLGNVMRMSVGLQF